LFVHLEQFLFPVLVPQVLFFGLLHSIEAVVEPVACLVGLTEAALTKLPQDLKLGLKAGRLGRYGIHLHNPGTRCWLQLLIELQQVGDGREDVVGVMITSAPNCGRGHLDLCGKSTLIMNDPKPVCLGGTLGILMSILHIPLGWSGRHEFLLLHLLG